MRALRHNFFNDSSGDDSGEAEVETLRTDSEAFVVDAELMQDRGMDVTDVDWILDCSETEIIGAAKGLATAKATTCKPHREGINVMVAAG